MKMTNYQVINILNASEDEAGKALRGKRLPVKLLYAYRKNLKELKAVYDAYDETRKELCQRYQVKETAMEEGGEEFQQEIITLLNLAVEVNVHTIPRTVTDVCGQGTFDALSMDDLDRLEWQFEQEE